MLSQKQLKYFSRLKQKKYRRAHNEFLVEGLRLCEELLRSDYRTKQIFICSLFGRNAREEKFLEDVYELCIPIERVRLDLLQRFCSTKTPVSVVACAQGRTHTLCADFLKGRRFVVLDSIADPGNVGTLFRTAEAFGWDGTILVGQQMEIYNPKILRSSMGAIFRHPICYSTISRMLSLFIDAGVSYVVTSPAGENVSRIIGHPSRLAVFLSNEAHGVNPSLTEKAYACVGIPMECHVDSLNVAVAGAILLYLLK